MWSEAYYILVRIWRRIYHPSAEIEEWSSESQFKFEEFEFCPVMTFEKKALFFSLSLKHTPPPIKIFRYFTLMLLITQTKTDKNQSSIPSLSLKFGNLANIHRSNFHAAWNAILVRIVILISQHKREPFKKDSLVWRHYNARNTHP